MFKYFDWNFNYSRLGQALDFTYIHWHFIRCSRTLNGASASGLSLCIWKVVSKNLVSALNLYFPISEFMDLGFLHRLGTYDLWLWACPCLATTKWLKSVKDVICFPGRMLSSLNSKLALSPVHTLVCHAKKWIYANSVFWLICRSFCTIVFISLLIFALTQHSFLIQLTKYILFAQS